MNPKFILTAAIAATLGFSGLPLRAADHADSPTTANDQGADVADAYAFMDPNQGSTDNVIIIGTFHGFIVPGEGGNFTTFDAGVRYRFSIENTGDAKADKFIDVTFSKRTDSSAAQTAKIAITGLKGTFEAPTTVSKLTANAPTQVVTALTNSKNANTGISFFAGMTDDPFFFDIPGFNRFVGSVLAQAPDVTFLDRGRDTFAGYNVLSIALSIPKSLLLSTKGATPPTKVGVSFATFRKTEVTSKGEKKSTGSFAQVDRTGVPGVNTVFIPYASKNAYNGGTTADDSKGKKFGPFIAATLTALGTNMANQNTLASVVGLPFALPDSTIVSGLGDYLRLDTAIVNGGANDLGKGGGANPEAGFPNGRRLRDDVIDTVLGLATNATVTTGDHVNANDVAFADVFPFLAPSQQPRDNGVVEDNTRN